MNECSIGAVAVIYATVGFATQSYIYNHVFFVKEPCEFCSVEKTERQVGSFLGGAFWPVYLASAAAHSIDAAITNSAKPLTCRTKDRQWPAAGNVCVIPEDLKSGKDEAPSSCGFAIPSPPCIVSSTDGYTQGLTLPSPSCFVFSSDEDTTYYKCPK
jgi:hypothetical protein